MPALPIVDVDLSATPDRPPPLSTPSIEVSRRFEDTAPASLATQQQQQQGFAADILTDGARRKLAATGKAFATVARAVTPSLKRFADAARNHLGGEAVVEEPPKHDDAPDLLDEERRDLLARFEELERRNKEK